MRFLKTLKFIIYFSICLLLITGNVTFAARMTPAQSEAAQTVQKKALEKQLAEYNLFRFQMSKMNEGKKIEKKKIPVEKPVIREFLASKSVRGNAREVRRDQTLNLLAVLVLFSVVGYFSFARSKQQKRPKVRYLKMPGRPRVFRV